jgi:hypothetical protein
MRMASRSRSAPARVGLCVFTIAVVWPGGGGAHTPITTKMLFNREIVRILKDNCLGCHRPGGIAPMSLATYEEARPWAKAIKEELLERRMPPWPAVRGFGEFSNAPRLTQRDIDAIVNWVDGGAPKGDAQLLPPGPLLPVDWPLGAPDAVLSPAVDFEVAAGADQRENFLLQTADASPRWLRAFDVRPGDGSVVHCASLYLESRQRVLLGNWVPGFTSAVLPDGVARLLPARARLVLRVHYRAGEQAARDRTAVALYFRARPERALEQLELPISGSRLRGSLRIAEPMEALALAPLATAGLTSLQATVTRPDGTREVLLWSRGQRSDWQPTYFFKTPVAIPRGARIEAIAHRDGAGPPAPEGASAAAEGSADPLVTILYVKPSRSARGNSGF